MTNPIATSKLTGLNKTYWHFAALWGLALMLMLNWAEGYRILIYLNLIIAAVYAYSHIKEPAFRKTALAIAVIPGGLTILHMVATGEFSFVKEVRHLWLSAFTCLSLLVLARRNVSSIKRVLPISAIVLLLIYCSVEMLALFVFNKPFGTNKNPHYLALYSSLAIPISIYLYLQEKLALRYILPSVTVLLGFFVLLTASRPAWIALAVTGVLLLAFLKGKARVVSGLLVIGIPLVLVTTNMAGFADRFVDLAKNIKNEERVTLWQDAWQMQQTSTVPEWVYGHGLDSYEDDFKDYSRYSYLVDFSSPHNLFLEVLYTSGVLGVILCFWLYYWIYRRLWQTRREPPAHEKIAVLLMSIMTINLLFIMITIPFISHYNIYTLAFVIGTIFYLKENSARRPDAA